MIPVGASPVQLTFRPLMARRVAIVATASENIPRNLPY